MKSSMQHNFARVPQAEIQRSSFDRSHGYKTTFDGGYLIPIFIDEALPGDTFNLHMTAFARLATPLKPLMDNLYLDSFFFAVPYRLVWEHWQNFNGEAEDKDIATDYTIPYVAAGGTGFNENEIGDFFGLPTGIPGIQVSTLPFRAYNLIWNEWFRDENLQSKVPVPKDDGPDTITDYTILRRGKRHDYFTSCLPWPQKHADVLLPLGTSAPVTGTFTGPNAAEIDGIDFSDAAGVYSSNVLHAGNTSGTEAPLFVYDPTGSGVGMWSVHTRIPQNAFTMDVGVGGTGLTADLSAATSATINAIREAFQIQRLYERDARGGTRYTEIIRSHFGVVSPDARLQRPEFLGGGSSPINIHPVPQTAPPGTTPQGNLAAFGTVSATGHGFIKSFTEHCIIIGLVSVRADLNYQQGLNRMWSRSTRFDFYWPALAHLGEQAVLNKEIYMDGSSYDNDVWGYQERYAEYRYKPSMITGYFRSQASGSLDVWHLAQDFGGQVFLDDTFIQDNPPIDRVIAVPSEPHFLFDSYFNFKCARPMPVYGVPGLIDHF